MNNQDLAQIKSLFHGRFVTEPAAIQEKLSKAKAFVFDWDGVFNDGAKNESGSSSFNEVDSMGINMLRFSHYLGSKQNPVTAIITGEKNNAAYMFARREHFHAIYYGIRNKKDALMHLCTTQNISPGEVVYFFDDVLDLAIAEVCSLRMMVGNVSSPLFHRLAEDNKLVDYITAAGGGHNAIREAVELLMGISGKYDDTISQRVHYSGKYNEYITARNVPTPSFYTTIDSKITEQTPQ